ncbi:Dps family protein [Acholeplasma hippikon]|uniref:DNA protection during starvation protein 2 n=1 Tax=Acholeplasma hippikon TaxID=264636 RepID=A0A449BKN7_9MOLU|nr:DNA starvation/stationary phase protection protein [Acholeplasma hippikon]VEU82897.1 DNA protection during starvation protein 2 [Acholeplasma hippikon]
MTDLQKQLNKQVANFQVLNVKLHHFHWYVKGPNFFTLHAKFEELYEMVNEYYDSFAERLLTIGGKPATKMQTYLELSSISETSTYDSLEMVDELIKDFKLVVLELKELTVLAQDHEDEQTADLAITTAEALEKHIWMLRAFLG